MLSSRVHITRPLILNYKYARIVLVFGYAIAKNLREFSFNLNPRAAYREIGIRTLIPVSFLCYLYLFPIGGFLKSNFMLFCMQDMIILGIIAIFVAAAFVMGFMRLWFVTNYDANLGNKVKGLSLSFDKLRKEVRAIPDQFSNDIEAVDNKEMASDLADLSNMTLEQAAESIGIDPEQLNNPLVRPLAEKIFAGIKEKAKGAEGDEPEYKHEGGY